jgi:hypothetical protein
MTPQAAPSAVQNGPGALRALIRRIAPLSFSAERIPCNYIAPPISGSRGLIRGVQSRHAARWAPTFQGVARSTLSDRHLRGELSPTEPGCVARGSVMGPT